MIEIIYEDGEALVIDKPARLPIETPRAGGAALTDHLDALKLGFHRAPVPVHRLDTDTSGCLLLARNPKVLKAFNRAFEERRVQKSYLAILDGAPATSSGTIDLALAKISSKEKGWRMVPSASGKRAITHWELVEKLDQYALIRFRPETGRTHQLRVHAAEGLGHPLLGDPVYGPANGQKCAATKDALRTMLHAESLRVERDRKPAIEASAKLPDDFRAILDHG